MNNNGLGNKVESLARCRKNEELYRAEMEQLEQELAESLLGVQLATAKALLATAKSATAVAEQDVRAEAMAAYEVTGDKRVHPAVEVISKTILEYDDELAMAYCRESYHKALKLNRREFERAAKFLEPKFVEIRQEPATRISRDLSEYLEEEAT